VSGLMRAYVMKPFRIQSDLWDDSSFYARFFIKMRSSPQNVL
jgi:hypothetical protein